MNACVQILPQSIPSVVRIKKQGTLHILTQNIEGNFTCHYCDFNSLKKTTVSEHISRIHPKEAGRQINPFECKYCDKKFQNKSAELHHVKTHHEITMTKCPFESCSYEAKNTTSLSTHYSRKHMPELTIPSDSLDMVECSICKKTMKKATAHYHVAKCSPLSPFFTGSVMCDGTEEVVLFKPFFEK